MVNWKEFFAPHDVEQDPITTESIESVIHNSPRRMRITEESSLHEPTKDGNDWSISLPFPETFKNTFQAMCQIELREGRKGNNMYAYIHGSSSDESRVEPIRRWLRRVENYVAIRDCLALSFALDYDREDGDPKAERTNMGALRTQAKTYGRSTTGESYAAADEIANAMIAFIEVIDVYQKADIIAGVPPSDPQKQFDLPAYLARVIAPKVGMDDACDHIVTVAKRPQVKNMALNQKLSALSGTIAVDPDVVGGKTVLLIEDLYQSGATINFTAMEILNAGASRVFGLSCVKTCRNSDNVME